MPKNKEFQIQLNKITSNHLYFGSFVRTLRLWNRELPKDWQMPGKGGAPEDVIWVQKLTNNAVADTDSARASRLLSGAEAPKEFWFEDEVAIRENLRHLLTARNGVCEQTEQLLRFLGYLIYQDGEISSQEKEELAVLSSYCFSPSADENELLDSRLTFLMRTLRIARRKNAEQLEKYRRDTRRLSPEQAADISEDFSLYQKVLHPAVAGKFHLLSTNIEPIGSFLDRKTEFTEIDQALKNADTVFLTGLSGIGKSEIARKYATEVLQKHSFDHVIYGIYDGSLTAMVEQCINISDTDGSWQDKIEKLGRLCELPDGERAEVLFIIDNFNVRREDLTDSEKECWDCLRRLRCKRLITSTERWPEFRTLNVERMGPEAETELFMVNSAPLDTGTDQAEARQLIEEVDGHTLAVELLAKTLKAERLKSQISCGDLMQRLRRAGLGEISVKKIKIHKDDAEHLGKAADIIFALFQTSALTDEQRNILSCVALFPVGGVSLAIFRRLFQNAAEEDILELLERGWLRLREDRVSVHPLIAQIALTQSDNAQQENTFSTFYENLQRLLTGALAAETSNAAIRIAANTIKFNILCPSALPFIYQLRDYLERENCYYLVPAGFYDYKREFMKQYPNITIPQFSESAAQTADSEFIRTYKYTRMLFPTYGRQPQMDNLLKCTDLFDAAFSGFVNNRDNPGIAEKYFRAIVELPIRSINRQAMLFGVLLENRNQPISKLLDHWQEWRADLELESPELTEAVAAVVEPLLDCGKFAAKLGC